MEGSAYFMKDILDRSKDLEKFESRSCNNFEALTKSMGLEVGFDEYIDC